MSFQPQPMDAKLRVCLLFLLCSLTGSRFFVFCHLVFVFWVVFSRLSMYFYSMCFWTFSCVCLLLKKADGATNSPRNYFKTKAKRLAEIAALILTQHRGGRRFQRPLDSRRIILVGNEGNNSQWFGGACITMYTRIYIYMNINCMHSIYTVRFVIYCSCFISYRTFRYSNNFRIQALRAFKISSFSICNLKVRMILFHFEGASFFFKKNLRFKK